MQVNYFHGLTKFNRICELLRKGLLVWVIAVPQALHVCVICAAREQEEERPEGKRFPPLFSSVEWS